MKSRSWKSIVLVGALAVALAVVLNPEVRAILLLAELLGLDLVLLLLATQARSILMAIGPWTTAVAERACMTGSALGGRALQAAASLPPLRVFAVLVCPLLVTLAFLVQCDRETGT